MSKRVVQQQTHGLGGGGLARHPLRQAAAWRLRAEGAAQLFGHWSARSPSSVPGPGQRLTRHVVLDRLLAPNGALDGGALLLGHRLAAVGLRRRGLQARGQGVGRKDGRRVPR